VRPEQFEAHARVESRHWWFTGRRAILQRLVRLVVPPGGSVADVGCGTGGNAAALAEEGFRVLGLDPSREAITLARRRFPSVDFSVGGDPGAAAAHLAGGGLLLMSDVLEHVADDRELMRQAIGAVPPGGHLLLTVPADPSLWSDHDTAFGHRRRYHHDDFAALWHGQPVAVRLLSPFNARLRSLIAAHRRLPRRRATAGGDLDVPMGPLNRVFHRIFAGEAERLAAAVDGDRAPWTRGVSLVALLRRQ
jgi:2-polyprenyl-3-methyl-5-hydroxy-6-metoxy-1,4-benzoquinol methylase